MLEYFLPFSSINGFPREVLVVHYGFKNMWFFVNFSHSADDFFLAAEPIFEVFEKESVRNSSHFEQKVFVRFPIVHLFDHKSLEFSKVCLSLDKELTKKLVEASEVLQ